MKFILSLFLGIILSFSFLLSNKGLANEGLLLSVDNFFTQKYNYINRSDYLNKFCPGEFNNGIKCYSVNYYLSQGYDLKEKKLGNQGNIKYIFEKKILDKPNKTLICKLNTVNKINRCSISTNSEKIINYDKNLKIFIEFFNNYKVIDFKNYQKFNVKQYQVFGDQSEFLEINVMAALIDLAKSNREIEITDMIDYLLKDIQKNINAEDYDKIIDNLRLFKLTWSGNDIDIYPFAPTLNLKRITNLLTS